MRSIKHITTDQQIVLHPTTRPRRTCARNEVKLSVSRAGCVTPKETDFGISFPCKPCFFLTSYSL